MGNFGMSVPFQELDDACYPVVPLADLGLDDRSPVELCRRGAGAARWWRRSVTAPRCWTAVIDGNIVAGRVPDALSGSRLLQPATPEHAIVPTQVLGPGEAPLELGRYVVQCIDCVRRAGSRRLPTRGATTGCSSSLVVSIAVLERRSDANAGRRGRGGTLYGRRISNRRSRFCRLCHEGCEKEARTSGIRTPRPALDSPALSVALLRLRIVTSPAGTPRQRSDSETRR